MSRTTIRSAGAGALLVSGVLLLTGCSSSSTATTASSSPSPSAAASASGGRGQAMEAYTTCLSQHGVTLPSRPSGRPSGHPSGNPSDRPSGGYGGGGYGGGFGASASPEMKAAMQACASLRPQGGQGRGNGGGLNSTAMQAFTGCMKDHGVTIPATGGLGALNTADPATAAAYKTCAPLLPARSPQPAAGATDSPSASAGA
ncbi:hypothetical protein P3T37_006135 [Kitasatospora sp. MAA4]|uniref:hypothetical protein n=1 Tax=Kitasatospora sp. MAA4 TaxID=3035093 RepID=UPI002474E6F6|nr:hypothetical protein [Kitasatospora sp. MAA4]MDH6136704.1 hypothetical protein [Kitasatospora sp. MAA4]